MGAKDYLDTVEVIRIGLQAAADDDLRSAEAVIESWEHLQEFYVTDDGMRILAIRRPIHTGEMEWQAGAPGERMIGLVGVPATWDTPTLDDSGRLVAPPETGAAHIYNACYRSDDDDEQT